MQDIIRDLKTYLLENFGNQNDFLLSYDLSVSKAPVKKVTPSFKQAPPPKVIAPKKEEPKAPPEPEEEIIPPPSFTSEKPKVVAHSLDPNMQALYKKIAPQMKLYDEPLKDDLAKQIRLAAGKRSSMPEIPILFDHSIQEHLDFLTSLSKAINASFGTSSVINIHEFEEKNLWKPLLAHSQIRLIIIPSSLLKHSSNLNQLTKEYPGRLLKSVEKIPLFALSEISDSPIRKKEIWGTLTRFFKS